MQFWHAKTPIYTYPRGWVPWYVEWAAGFPRCPSGGVSINVWSGACATVILVVSDLVGLLVGMAGGRRKVPQAMKMEVPIGGPTGGRAEGKKEL